MLDVGFERAVEVAEDKGGAAWVEAMEGHDVRGGGGEAGEVGEDAGFGEEDLFGAGGGGDFDGVEGGLGGVGGET